jgi:F0F1-type ATP synthase assembly protein I
VSGLEREPAKREWRDVKRQAGCLLGCLTEPFVIIALVIGSIFGAYSIGRKAERARRQVEQDERDTQEPRDD